MVSNPRKFLKKNFSKFNNPKYECGKNYDGGGSGYKYKFDGGSEKKQE